MKARSANNEVVPEIVEFNEKFWHCIHPEFLTEEITASMSRLGIETIDVYLLHNPEYFYFTLNAWAAAHVPNSLQNSTSAWSNHSLISNKR